MLQKLKNAEKNIAENRQEVIDGFVKVSISDLMVFWGTERELVKRQEKLWQPIIKWLEEYILHDRLTQTSALEVPHQHESLVDAFTSYINKMSNEKLAVFYVAAMNLRSVMITIAFVEKKITAEQAFNAAYIEEIWQNETWGTTDEAAERQESIRNELSALEKYINENL